MLRDSRARRRQKTAALDLDIELGYRPLALGKRQRS